VICQAVRQLQNSGSGKDSGQRTTCIGHAVSKVAFQPGANDEFTTQLKHHTGIRKRQFEKGILDNKTVRKIVMAVSTTTYPQGPDHLPGNRMLVIRCAILHRSKILRILGHTHESKHSCCRVHVDRELAFEELWIEKKVRGRIV
jgi:hypothetical protein